MQDLIDALEMVAQVQKMLNIEAALCNVFLEQPTDEMLAVYAVAEHVPVTPSLLWRWYRLHKIDICDFIDAICRAWYYSQAEGLYFEALAYEYVREAAQP